jgi:hypothetical protein
MMIAIGENRSSVILEAMTIFGRYDVAFYLPSASAVIPWRSVQNRLNFLNGVRAV